MAYADTTLAEKELGWKAEKALPEMCEDAWRWQCNFPEGYPKVSKEFQPQPMNDDDYPLI